MHTNHGRELRLILSVSEQVACRHIARGRHGPPDGAARPCPDAGVAGGVGSQAAVHRDCQHFKSGLRRWGLAGRRVTSIPWA